MYGLEDQLTEELASGRFDERVGSATGRWFAWLLASIGALCLASMMFGCMTLEVSNSVLVNSTISQDKPIRAGLSTTGEAIGEALKAAGYGNPLSIGEIKQLIDVVRSMRQKESRLHPILWKVRPIPKIHGQRWIG